MLSPFRGVMHSVVTEWADAVTTDGREWTLYVRGECLYDDLADFEGEKLTIPDVKYGTWSAAAGFARSPIRLPTFDAKVRHEGERLLTAVQAHADQLPFPLTDRFEYWLLHGESRLPLALIASSCSSEFEPPAMLRWTPGQLCMAEMAESRTLHDAVNRLAGEQPQAMWFERHADGSGTPVVLAGGAAVKGETPLTADTFAEFYLDANALDDGLAHLFEQVLAWQAPALLQLPTLSNAQRREFETAACRHALRLAEQLTLYPCVLDETQITAALVEARLRRTTGATLDSAASGGSLSPDYIEIPDA